MKPATAVPCGVVPNRGDSGQLFRLARPNGQRRDVMDTIEAMARGQAAMGQPQRVFDWEKAARIIVERKATNASAGLGEDWGYTGGTILDGGKPVTSEYVYLSSDWATPELHIDGDEIECWRYEKDAPGWDAHTTWPKEALAILEAK